jgi:4-hydroxy-4-methyl-2-oxoglutarate aldolase
MSINTRVDKLSPDLVEGFLHVDPATVGHFIHFGFVDSGIKPLWRPVKIAGPAFTIRTLAMDTTMLHRCFEYVKPGDVLVIDRCGDMVHAGFGGVVAFAAMVQKVAGVVIDGLATDIREIEEYRLPVFARGLTALTTKMWGMGGAINVPVSIGGVTVRPGDLVTADDNGILVLDPEEAPALLKRAQDAEIAEKILKEKMRSGVCLTDLSGSRRLIDADLPAVARKIRYPA